jgi:hypothetical protein
MLLRRLGLRCSHHTLPIAVDEIDPCAILESCSDGVRAVTNKRNFLATARAGIFIEILYRAMYKENLTACKESFDTDVTSRLAGEDQ